MSGRTSAGEIQVLSSLFNHFRPDELSFLLEVESVWSMFDPSRADSITTILSSEFSYSFPVAHVREALHYFAVSNCVLFRHKKCVRDVLSRHGQLVHVDPYSRTCPICSLSLDLSKSRSKSVTVYGEGGSVEKGWLSRV